MNLSGLSAVYPGYSAQENSTAVTEQNQFAAKEAAIKLLGAQVLGRAFTGGQQSQGPQPPQPGQQSMPAPPPGQPPNPMVQGGPPAASAPPLPPQAPPMAQGAAGAPPSAGGSGMPELSLATLAQRIIATTPQVRQHPEILMAALERATPILDRQSKEDLAELRKEYQTRSLEQRGQIAAASLEAAKANRDRVGDQRDAALELQKSREARLTAGSAVQQDQGYQRLQLQERALAERAQSTGDKSLLAQWRAVVDARHKRATEIIQANSQMSGLSKGDKKALLDEQRAAYESDITAMRGSMGSTTPTGGTVAPGAAGAPKVQGQVAPGQPGLTAAPPVVNAPPLAALKPNTVTTFENGQKWTVGPDGQPKQVQ